MEAGGQGFERPPERLGPYRILGRIGTGGMGVVYRAVHVDTGEPAAVKTVRVPHGSELAGIRIEIITLKSIHHPGVVRILDAGVTDGVPWFAMELLDGQTLSSHLEQLWGGAWGEHPSRATDGPFTMYSAQPHPIEPQTYRPWYSSRAQRLPWILTLFRRICAPLAYLHGHGIIHRDLKPANVFIRANGQVILMDFGLVMRFHGAVGRESLEVAGVFAGTAAYMSPEQIRRQPVDARSDLYALGCMLYEAITGQRPFTGRTARELMEQHLTVAPLPPSEASPDVPPVLDKLILRLLAKHPRDRMGHAEDVDAVLASLGAAGGEPGGGQSVSYSYLYRPEVLGRDDVLNQLGARVERARAGAGGRVLIRGESGVGKTFLMAEVARRAAERGFRVVICECVPLTVSETGGLDIRGSPLQPLRPLLQAVGDCGRERGKAWTDAVLGPRGKTLAAYEPSLRELPGQDAYPEPASVDAEAANQRMMKDLATTLSAFVDQEGPILLALDDLQWADELTLKFYASVPETFISTRSLFFVGTYRSEEVSAPLAQLIEQRSPPQVTLGGLDEATIGEMVAQMLALTEVPRAFVHFLAQQSEGNPFFVAEYLRASVNGGLLYREAGTWRLASGALTDADLAAKLPLPRSIGELIRRRLSSLSPGARSLVECASVIGREVDANVLIPASGMSEQEVADALKSLVFRQVLEVSGAPGDYQFVHDKLRQSTYQAIPPERRRSLHRQVAATLEQRLSSTGGGASVQYSALAHHWTQAEVWDKAIEYLEKAGAQALRNSANREAVVLFTQAIELERRLPQRARPSRLARWERSLVEAYFQLGQSDEAEEHVRRTLHHCGRVLPSSRWGWRFGLLVETARTVLPRHRPRSDEEAALLDNAASVLQRMIERSLLRNEPIQALYCGLKSRNLASQLPPSGTLARSYALLTVAVGVTPFQGAARRCSQRSREVADSLGLDYVRGYCLSRVACFSIQAARWAEADTWMRESIQLARRARDLRQLEDALAIQGEFRHIHERFTGSLDSCLEHLTLARERGDAQSQSWARILLARNLLRLGREAEAIGLLEETRPWLEKEASNGESMWAYGCWALSHLQLGQLAPARAMAERALRLMRQQRPAAYFIGPSVSDTAETLLRLQETSPGDRSLVRMAREACRFLHVYSRRYIFTQPAALLWRGTAAWREGHPGRAHHLWRRALARAEQLQLPHSRGKAHFELGRHLGGSPEREVHLQRACELFTSSGALRDLARARHVLAAKVPRRPDEAGPRLSGEEPQHA